MLNGKNLRRKSGCAYPNPDRRGRDRRVRGTYSSSSIWTDGVIGTNDDITTEPARSSYTNFDAAYIEAVGARVFEKVDPAYAAYALKIAKDDFHWGITIYREQQARHYRQNPMVQSTMVGEGYPHPAVQAGGFPLQTGKGDRSHAGRHFYVVSHNDIPPMLFECDCQSLFF